MVAYLNARTKLDTAERNPATSADVAFDDGALATIHDFGARMRERGIKVIVMPLAILDLEYARQRNNIEGAYGRLLLAGADGMYSSSARQQLSRFPQATCTTPI